MMTLENLANDNIEGRSRLIDRISTRPESLTNSVFLNLWFCEESFAILAGIKNDLRNAKLAFNNCLLLDEYRIKNYNDRFFDSGLNHISYALLTDNEPVLQRYAKLRYQRGVNAKLGMDEMVAQGESPIWCNTVQFFMANDKSAIERNLNILETITLKKLSKREELLIVDYNFFRALHEHDKGKIEETLAILVSPKIHKKRNDNPILNQYVSVPAIGYAKLAWRKGIEVVIDTPLIPKELLPVRPLERYEIPYAFLK